MTKINYSEVLTKCVFKKYTWLNLMTSQLYKCIKTENVLKGKCIKKEMHKKGNAYKRKYI